MSALFDRYAIVDWSAANTPTSGKDSIWISFAEREDGDVRVIETINPETRTLAMRAIEDFLLQSLDAGKRVFAGFDFPFGYPAGAARAIAGEADWKALWTRIAALIQDRDDNVSNRFEIAGRLNRESLADAPMYWARPAHLDIPGLSPAKPDPYPTGLPERRLAELRVRRAQPVWKLAYQGSVGSQALLGIARLCQLVHDERFAGRVAVWPFETNFDADLSSPCVLAEIYPSIFPIEPQDDQVPDQTQVETLARGFAGLDAEGKFRELLAAPTEIVGDQKALLLKEEGWIVGIGFEASGFERQRSRLSYMRNPAAIYEKSFEIISGEVDFGRVPPRVRELAIRLIHACGMTDIVEDLVFSEGAVEAGRAALRRGAPILCDSEMVAHGIIREALPAGNQVICHLNDSRVPRLAEALATTRSAAQVDLWEDRLEGAVVAIGNAPTALFRLLEKLDEGAPRPAVILGFPVGFVGAVESKEELAGNPRGAPFITLKGRRGGSAMAAAAVNALAKGLS